jgi:hypothetical protein
VPVSHITTLARAARRAREDVPGTGDLEVLVIQGGQHSWLYEYASYRGAVASFLTRSLGGPLEAAEAEAIARAVPAARLPQREHPFSAIEPERTGLQRLIEALRVAGGSRIPEPERLTPAEAAAAEAAAAEAAAADMEPA